MFHNISNTVLPINICYVHHSLERYHYTVFHSLFAISISIQKIKTDRSRAKN